MIINTWQSCHGYGHVCFTKGDQIRWKIKRESKHLGETQYLELASERNQVYSSVKVELQLYFKMSISKEQKSIVLVRYLKD